MKKTIIALVAILAGLTTTAQKTTKYAVGTVAYEKQTNADATYSINPLVGYYVTDKSSVGVFGSVGTDGTTDMSSIGVFGRNDFLHIGKNCSVFAQASIGKSSTKMGSSKYSEFEAKLGLGANYSINSKWGLTMHLCDIVKYVNTNNAPIGNGGQSTFTFGFGAINNPFAVSNLGVAYKF